jgi:hypothetical protein
MRVGVVDREDVTFSGREARKALSMLIVRGTCFFCMTFDQYFRLFERWGKRKGKGRKTYAIESDTFQSDLPHQFRRLYRISLRRSGLVQLR